MGVSSRPTPTTMSQCAIERLGPGLEALFLGQLLGVRVVADVPLLQECARRVLHVVAALPGGPARDDHVVLGRQVELHGVVVDLGDAGRGGRRLVGAPAGIDPVIPLQVLHHEHDVVDDEWIAVRPLGARAQLQGDGEAVGRHVVALGDVGQDLARLLVHLEQVDVHLLVGHLVAAPVHCPNRIGHVQRAAVLSDAVGEHLLHHRFDGDALIERRQLAGRHHGRQHRRLAELPARHHRGAAGTAAPAVRLAAGHEHRRRRQHQAERQHSVHEKGHVHCLPPTSVYGIA